MSEKRFEKGFTKIGHIHCIFEDGKETNMLFHDNDDNINPYCKDGKSDLDRVVDKLNKLSDEKEQLRQFINKGRRLSVKELMDNANENEILKKKIRELQEENEQLKAKVKRLQDIATRTEEEKEHYADLYNECRRLKFSDKAIKQAYAELNRREREKHCNGDITFTATMKQNEVVY